MTAALTASEILDLLPQREPFRFVDELLEWDDNHIVAAYRWRPDHDFYRGHFPGHPVTPGVILLEAMAQVGVVALGIHLLSKERTKEELQKTLTLFSDATVEFSGIVQPGDRVIISARKVFFRRGKLRSDVAMHLEDGRLVCSATVAGVEGSS